MISSGLGAVRKHRQFYDWVSWHPEATGRITIERVVTDKEILVTHVKQKWGGCSVIFVLHDILSSSFITDSMSLSCSSRVTRGFVSVLFIFCESFCFVHAQLGRPALSF